HELGLVVGRLSGLADERRAKTLAEIRTGLGDEYEGRGFVGLHDELHENDNGERQEIDGYLNLTHHYIIGNPTGPPGAIKRRSVKRALVHRLRAASMLTADARPLSSNRLEVRVSPVGPELDKWRGAKTDDADVFLRSRTINHVGPTRWLLEGPLKVEEVQ